MATRAQWKTAERDYNHSTWLDILIPDLLGLVPRNDDILELDPLLPRDRLELFSPRRPALSRPRRGDRLGRSAFRIRPTVSATAARGSTCTLTASWPPRLAVSRLIDG